MREKGVRYKGKTNEQTELNKVPGHEKELKDEVFVERESTITVLIESSLHLRTIYHMFIVILHIVFYDTLIYDLVERGKINVGIDMFVHGFGGIERAFKLWMFELLVALSFYHLLLVYAWLGKLSRNCPGLRHATIQLGLIGLIGTQLTLTTIPVYDLVRKPLALGSSAIVTAELFRFMMKIVSVAASCGPRCLNGKTPLPTFQHYVYFLFAPTLLYRDQYPRTKRIRWGKVLFHFGEVAAIIFYNSFLFERFIVPYWSDYGKQSRVEAGTVVRGIFACVFPGILSFICGFYCILHAWLNAWAEMLRFADRLFYEDWWTTSHFSLYYRRWNRVVHSWLREYIYVPLAPSLGRPMSTVIVFLVSSMAHEVMIAFSFGFFYPVLLVEFGVLGVLMLPLTAINGRRYPNVFNIIMWLAIFTGNGLLWSLYPMEYYARKNCPPSKSDSFFIPKSWSCPEIILKPGWTFQNPFSLLLGLFS